MHQIWEHYVWLVATWEFLVPKSIEYTINLLSSYLDKQRSNL